MDRISIKKQKIFFQEILKTKKLSLRALSKKLNINYSNLKRFARGENSIPQDVFDKLMKRSKRKKYWLKRIEHKSRYWGQSKAGKKWVLNITKKDLIKKMEIVRSFRTIKKARFNINKNFYEFYGIMLGDGCISKFKKKGNNSFTYTIHISGHKLLDYSYHKDYIKPLIKNVFDKNCYIYRYRKNNSMYLRVISKEIALKLHDYGFPFGKKGQKIKLTDELYNLGWEKKKNIIKGVFDTDGCISAKKHEKFKYPYIIISLSSVKLLKQIHKILRERGYPFDIRDRKGIRASEIRMRGNKNLIKWMNDVGSNNPRHIIKYEYWKKEGMLPTNINWACRLAW